MKANVCKIDSLRLFMPLDKVTLKNISSYTVLTVNEGTGEVLKKAPPKAQFMDRGINTTMVVDTKPWGRGIMKEGLSLTVHAKQLGKDYFEGINSNNIRDVHQYLNSLTSDIQIPMNSLLNARASDIDFCRDSKVLSDLDFRELVKDLNIMCRNSKIQNWNPLKNGQFYIQDRKTARDSTPFAKLYRKELEYKGSEHQEQFFNDVSFLKNTTRAEVTMKNSVHLKRFSNGGIESSYFRNVLEGDYTSIVQNVFNHYFGDSKKTIKPRMTKPKTEFKPIEAYILSTLEYAMNEHPKSNDKLIVIQSAFEMLCSHLSDRNKKEKRKQIELIYDSYIGSDSVQREKEFSQYLKNIGLSN